jgi:hypothetical protein
MKLEFPSVHLIESNSQLAKLIFLNLKIDFSTGIMEWNVQQKRGRLFVECDKLEFFFDWSFSENFFFVKKIYDNK